MYVAKIENSHNEILTLTQNEDRWQVESITGLNPPPATINMTPIASMDGSKFNSARIETRQLVIMLRIKGEVEANRLELYRFFRTKEECKFYFKNERRDVWISGHVETCEVDLFERGELMQIAIICAQPYFKGIDQISEDMSSVVAAFVFPFSINSGDPVAFSELDVTRETLIRNETESESGMEFDIRFMDSVSRLKIADVTTGETLELRYAFLAGDRVLINTNRGSKSIVLTRSGADYNLFSALVKGSTFFQLRLGDNYFSYLADSGVNNANVSITVLRYNQYRGV